MKFMRIISELTVLTPLKFIKFLNNPSLWNLHIHFLTKQHWYYSGMVSNEVYSLYWDNLSLSDKRWSKRWSISETNVTYNVTNVK